MSHVMRAASIGPRDIDGVVVHATTIVTNALIERKGPPTALLVTEGFRDVLHIRDEHRYEMYDPQIEFSEPLVPSELTFGVSERVGGRRLDDSRAGSAADRGSCHRTQGEGFGFARDLLSQQLCQSEQRTRGWQAARGAPTGRLPHAVVRCRAADPRISARLDRRCERVHHANLAAISARSERAAQARGISELAAHYVVVRRRGRRRDRRT